MQLLTIAEGTPVATTVRDVRLDLMWAQRVANRPPGPPRAIFIHHTASAGQPTSMGAQIAAMRRIAESGVYGLPYNFVVFCWPKTSIYYLNDVDALYPHTYRWNDATAIAFWGDFTTQLVPEAAVSRAWRLIQALRVMWVAQVPVRVHREVYPTICPGDELAGIFGRNASVKLVLADRGAPVVRSGCPQGTPPANTLWYPAT